MITVDAARHGRPLIRSPARSEVITAGSSVAAKLLNRYAQVAEHNQPGDSTGRTIYGPHR